MNYCAACKRVSFTEDARCECGHKYKKKLSFDEPVFLVKADGSDRRSFEKCLAKAEIPYSVIEDGSYSPVVGKLSGDAAILVPLGFLKKGIDALVENGLMQRPEWYEKLELPDEPVWEEMSPVKRTTVRALSIVVFLFLIYLCVAGVDVIAQLFEKLWR